MTMVNLNPDASAACGGLCLHLDAEQLKALGLDKHPLKPGAQVSLRASATVRHAAAEQEAGKAEGTEEKDCAEGDCAAEENEAETGAIELHITGLEVSRNGREPASVLYGGKRG